MRFFLDTEFIEDGHTIDLISIGMAAEDGRELYLQNTECGFRHASLWVKENVYPHLHYFDDKALKPRIGQDEAPGAWSVWASRKQIAERVVAFCDPEQYGTPEFWGYYSAYDHMALCQLFGTMMDLPKGWPMWTNDIQQWAHHLGISDLSEKVPQTDEHHALADAKWNRAAYEYIGEHLRERLMKSAMLSFGVRSGAISPNEMARQMGWPTVE